MLRIYQGNGQLITISGLSDTQGNPIAWATIRGVLYSQVKRPGIKPKTPLLEMNFRASETPGNFAAQLKLSDVLPVGPHYYLVLRGDTANAHFETRSEITVQ